jgi:hypothetical protein
MVFLQINSVREKLFIISSETFVGRGSELEGPAVNMAALNHENR